MSAPRLPGFTFIEHLGSGGFADVFLYEQEWPRQRVAVKVVRPDIEVTEREKQLFTAEANAMARLADHPYIVSVVTAGLTPDTGRPYLVMRYCPPPDLGVRVRHNPMSVPDAVSTGIKLASAIETAHRSGILHRDIKPSNVLVTSYHEPALTDFGIAGHMTDVATESDVRVSYPWSPPELLDGRSNGSVASDVYSLGATIWHLLVGRSPFSIPNGDNSTRALSARILHASPPATQRPDVPPALDRLLQQCLAKQPGQRPSSALEVARALQQVQSAQGWPRTQVAVEGDRTAQPMHPGPQDEESGTQVRPVQVVSASHPRKVTPAVQTEEPEPRRRSAVVWAVLAAVAVVGGVAAVWASGGLSGGDRPGDGTPTTASTPLPLDTDELRVAPAVTAERASEGRVRISWTTDEALETGDRWLWQVEESGRWARTDAEETEVTIRSTGPVCVQVRLVRGSVESPYGRDCVA